MRLSHKRKVRSKKGIGQAAWEARQKRRLRRVRPVVWIVPNRIGKTSKFWSARQEMARIMLTNRDPAAVHLSDKVTVSDHDLVSGAQAEPKPKAPRFTDRLVNGFKRFFGVSA
uniref:Uncharacterized protein n=1 Tax=Enterovibrio sp. FF_113 TaxID=1660266 RepID=A0A0H3ZW48_9GAMM|nr:hypothetical protein [Enterovibrio sp. FF_113]